MPRPIHRPRPSLESLDARIVPSGNRLDLTRDGAEATANGAIFRQTTTIADADQLDTFVALDTRHCWHWSEQGYNTDARPTQFNEKRDRDLTHALTLGDVPTVTEGGQTYREFVLTTNQRWWGKRVSLDELRVYTHATGDVTGYNSHTKKLGGAAAVYDLDAGRNRHVVLRDRHGAGTVDMVLLVPESAFAGASPDTFVYLYSKFGGAFGVNGGAETWGVRPAAEPPPVDPAALSGYVYVDSNNNGGRDGDEAGIPGVTITLTGVNDLGESVLVTTETEVDGSYRFDGLRPGVYAIQEAQPADFDDGDDQVGGLGGVAGDDLFTEIEVTPGAAGDNYNFSERIR